MAEVLMKHEAKSSALLASRLHTECFISRKARARQHFYYFQRNTLIKTCLLVHCNLNSASLFIFISYNYARADGTSLCISVLNSKFKLSSYQIVLSLVYKHFVSAKCLKNGQLKHSRMELFTVSGMLTYSKWYCLQRCELSMHNCTLFSFEVS